MTDLTDKQKMEYFYRSYVAADGLWFMKIEENYGFEAALEMDEAVWKVLPKIQSRIIKSMMNLDKGLDGLEQAVAARLDLEGFGFELERDKSSIVVIIRKCPWHDLILKSGRENIFERVGDLICRVENLAWASEFGGPGSDEIRFQREDGLCKGAKRCVLRFSK
jgi:Family of unknown function (DUF6125)/L-2-amino-thiazoline-4-carboxylic acid hydrolase